MNSKITGVNLIAGSDERWPMFVVFESCKYCQDYIPMLERHPDDGRTWDAQDKGEATHIADVCRLACMAHEVVNDAPTDTEAVIARAVNDKRNTRKTVRNLIPDLGF
jgi:hypothetical protein